MALFLLGGLLMLTWSGVMSTCPEKDGMANFDPQQYFGLWYSVYEPDQRWPGSENMKCAHSLLRQDRDDDQKIFLLFMLFNTSSGQYQTTRGKLWKAVAGSTDAKYVGEFGDNHWPAKYVVLHTDYTHYAVVFLCRPKPQGEGNIELTIVMSREKTLDQSYRTAAQPYVPEGVQYKNTTQIDCQEHDHEGHGAHGHAHHH